MKLVETAIRNARLTISVLVFLIIAGALAYVSIPKEAEPDIQIPIIYVSMTYTGHLARGFASGCCCGRWRRS